MRQLEKVFVMRKSIVFAAVLTNLLFAGAAIAKTYSCTVTPDHSGAWISKALVFNIDDNSGMIKVYDGILKTYQGMPVAAKLSAQTVKRTTIKWETRRVRDDYANSAARFMFRASYYNDSGKVITSSIPGSWDNLFGGAGHCTISSDAGWDAAVTAVQNTSFTARGKARFFRQGDVMFIWP